MSPIRFYFPFLSALLLALAVSGAAASAYANLSLAEKQELMEKHYALAIQFYNDKDYSQAIENWQEVLAIDPEQTTPVAMIAEAKTHLAGQIAPLQATLDSAMQSGKYDLALEKAQELIQMDPSEKDFVTLMEKLEEVTAIKAQETGTQQASRLVRKALYAYLSGDKSPKFSVNAVRYAHNLSPEHPGVREFLTYLEEMYPDVADRERIPQGVSVVDHKLFIALNHIYEGRYDLAIFSCDEALQLDPQNTLALKRKGSSYFALGQKDKARSIWRQALKISPKDPEIKKFLRTK